MLKLNLHRSSCLLLTCLPYLVRACCSSWVVERADPSEVVRKIRTEELCVVLVFILKYEKISALVLKFSRAEP